LQRLEERADFRDRRGELRNLSGRPVERLAGGERKKFCFRNRPAFAGTRRPIVIAQRGYERVAGAEPQPAFLGRGEARYGRPVEGNGLGNRRCAAAQPEPC